MGVNPRPAITRARIFRYSLPLRYPLPLKCTRLLQRCGLVLELTDDSGRVAYGEAAPLPDFSRESLDQAGADLVQACGRLLAGYGLDGGGWPSVAFALESALYGLTVHRWQESPPLAPLLLDPVVQRLSAWQKPWPKAFKLKVARGALAQDIDRVGQLLDRLPAAVAVRLDANQRWDLPVALAFVRGLEKRQGYDVRQRIDYIEEPLKDIRELAQFHRQTGIGLALDESLQGGRRLELSSLPGLRALVIKPTLTGGLSFCQQLISAGQRLGIQAVFSSAFESAIGVHWLAQLSALWLPGAAAGLDTLSAFAHPLISRLPEPGCALAEDDLNSMELLWQDSRR